MEGEQRTDKGAGEDAARSLGSLLRLGFVEGLDEVFLGEKEETEDVGVRRRKVGCEGGVGDVDYDRAVGREAELLQENHRP